MARAYSDDLRKKLLKAYVAGQGTLRELAVRFDVSVAWAWKVSSAYKKTGSMERQPQVRHGRRSRVDVERIKQLLDARPDLTLRGLVEALTEAGTPVSQSHLWRVVRGLGIGSKKVDPRRRTRYRSQPPTARRVPSAPRGDPAGTSDFPR